MSKRRLSHQQRKRIENRQQRHVEHAQTQKDLQTVVDGDDLAQGLVLANLGRTAEVENADGEVMACNIRQSMATLVPGDRVVWQEDAQQGRVVVAVEPRDTGLVRYNHRGEAKLMAANLNQLLIVLAPNPPPHWTLIDRYIVLAHHLGLTPVLIFNKVDLQTENENPHVEKLADYQKLNYKIIYTSIVANVGIDAFKSVLQNKASTLVGQSGVGKSALAKIVLPEHDITIADDDDDESKDENARLGKHTTTTARLYHVSTGGDLIDSPGVRVMHMTGLNRQEIQAGFKDIAAAAAQCRYRDCQHQAEPKCAVQAALAEGVISPRRFQSFLDANVGNA